MATTQCELSFDTALNGAATQKTAQGFDLVSRAAGKTFKEFLNGLLSTKGQGPWNWDAWQKSEVCAAKDVLRTYAITERDNPYANPPADKYGSWDAGLESGRNYLAGDSMPMDTFLKTFRRDLTPWQKLAFEWCTANPHRSLHMESRNGHFYYVIQRRGEYVEFGLPHQDQGGEKHWICRDGHYKVKVNQD